MDKPPFKIGDLVVPKPGAYGDRWVDHECTVDDIYVYKGGWAIEIDGEPHTADKFQLKNRKTTGDPPFKVGDMVRCNTDVYSLVDFDDICRVLSCHLTPNYSWVLRFSGGRGPYSATLFTNMRRADVPTDLDEHPFKSGDEVVAKQGAYNGRQAGRTFIVREARGYRGNDPKCMGPDRKGRWVITFTNKSGSYMAHNFKLKQEKTMRNTMAHVAIKMTGSGESTKDAITRLVNGKAGCLIGDTGEELRDQLAASINDDATEVWLILGPIEKAHAPRPPVEFKKF